MERIIVTKHDDGKIEVCVRPRDLDFAHSIGLVLKEVFELTQKNGEEWNAYHATAVITEGGKTRTEDICIIIDSVEEYNLDDEDEYDDFL